MHAPVLIHVIYVTADNSIMYQHYVHCASKHVHKQLSFLSLYSQKIISLVTL